MVNKDAVRLIIKECCSGLGFDSQTESYSLCLKHGCGDIWCRLRPQLKNMCGGIFTLEHFNRCLDDIIFLHKLGNVQILPYGIDNVHILPGESLEIKFEENVLNLTKMSDTQFVTQCGNVITFPSTINFAAETPIVTSEGKNLGTPVEIGIKVPLITHIAAGAIFLSGYYKRPVAKSLWPIHALAAQSGRSEVRCQEILKMASDMGLGMCQLFSVINSYQRKTDIICN